MEFIIMLLVVAAGYVLGAALVATFYNLPNGKLDGKFVQGLIRGTQKLRTGTTFEKFMFWGVPVLIMMFFNWLIGMLLLAAAITASIFSGRYGAYLLKNAPVVNPDGVQTNEDGRINVGHYDDVAKGPTGRGDVNSHGQFDPR